MESGPETPAPRASAPNAPTPLRAVLRRAWTARRRLATAAGGLLALYLAFGMLLLPGLVARRVEFLLEHELLALVRVGRAWVNPLTFRTWLEDIDIIEGGPHGGSRAARLRRVELDIDALATLLTAHPVLDRLLIEGARLRVEIDATGEMNWTRMARAAAREYAEWDGWPALRIGRAEVRDAVIELIDRSGPEPVQRLISGEGHIGGLDTRAAARSTVQLMLSTHLGESARFTGTFSAAGHELDGRFALSHLRPAELMGYLSRVMDGRVTRGRAEARGTLTARVTPRGSPELRLRIERAGVGDLSIRQDAQEALSAAWIGTDGASLELAGGSRGFIITAPRCTAESVRVVTTRDPEGRLRLMDLFPTRRAVADAGSDPPVPSPSISPRERSDDPRRWIPAQLVRGVRDGLAGLRLSARIDGVEGVALILTDLAPGAWYAPPIDPGVGPGDAGRPRPVVHRLVAGEASALLNVSPESATIDFSLAGTYNAGTARLEGSASSHPPRARLSVALQGVDLATLRHYLPPTWVEGWPEAEVRRGQGGAEGSLTLSRPGDGALHLEWSGRLEAAGFRSVRSGDTRPQLDVARLRAVGPLTISLRGQDLALDWTIETDAERFDLEAPLIGETSGVRAALAAARGHLRVRSPAMGSILVGWQGQTTATGVEIRGQRPEPLQITTRTFAADGGLDLSVSPDGATSAQWRGRAHGDALSLRTALGDVRELRGERVEAQGEVRVHVPADDRYDIHLGGSAEIRGGLVNPPPPEGAQEAPPDTAPAEVRLAVAGLSARGTIDMHGGEAGGPALTMQGQAELESATGSWPVRAEGAPSTAVEASAGRLESDGRLSVAAEGLTLEGRTIGETLSVAHLGAGLRFQTARSDLRGGAGVRADGAIEARGLVLADHVHAGLDPERAASSAIAADLARWGGWTGGEVRISALSISDAALDTRRKELSARTISALAPSADLRVRIGTDRDAERSEGHSGPDPSPARAEDVRADSWRLGVDLIEVNEARVTVRDPASTPPMQAELTDVKAAVRGLRIDPDAISRPDLAAVAPATLAASARVEQTGRGEVEATIDLASAHPRVEARVRTSDVPLKPFEAYVGRYLGYLVTEGRLTLDLPVTIAQRRVEGTINAQLDRFYLGEATGSRDAPGVPVKLGLALLRDRQERIDVRIPFSGDLTSPTFSMGGVIWQAIVGLVVKTATAPFQILAAILNLGGETDLSRASFDPGTAELTGDGLRVTDLLARALRERPGLALEVAAQISPEHDLPAMRLQRLRREALEEHRQTAGAGASLDDAAFREWVTRRVLPMLPPPAPPPPPSIQPPAPPTRAGAAAPPAEVPAADQPSARPGTPPTYESLLGLLLDRVVITERDLEDLVNARIERAIAAIRASLESSDAPNATPGTDGAPRVRRAAAGTPDGARDAGAAGAAAPCPCAIFVLR